MEAARRVYAHARWHPYSLFAACGLFGRGYGEGLIWNMNERTSTQGAPGVGALYDMEKRPRSTAVNCSISSYVIVL